MKLDSQKYEMKTGHHVCYELEKDWRQEILFPCSRDAEESLLDCYIREKELSRLDVERGTVKGYERRGRRIGFLYLHNCASINLKTSNVGLRGAW